MNLYELKEALDIHKFFRGFRAHPPTGWWFRGHADVEWPLLPKAGRDEYYLPEGRDLGRFKDWKQKAFAYNRELPANDWECLALAQHHGLATRLLDWTFNPLVGVYFACSSHYDNDGAVYCYDPELFIDKDNAPLDSIICGAGLISRAFSLRILNQKGIFTVHNPPNETICVKEHTVWKNHTNLAKLIIPKSLKRELLTHLDDYGINKVTLFPDLDGLSSQINLETSSMVEFYKSKN